MGVGLGSFGTGELAWDGMGINNERLLRLSSLFSCLFSFFVVVDWISFSFVSRVAVFGDDDWMCGLGRELHRSSSRL